MTTASVKLPPVAVLEEMYHTNEVVNADGVRRRLHSAVAPAHAWALYQTVLRLRPTMVVEVGMGYGGSTLSILAGLAALGAGKLISIDPGQHRDFAGIGLNNVRRAGFGDYHQLIAEQSLAALPTLLKEGALVDLAYIDGWHTFDYTLVDFFFLDKMLPVGGVVGFNDCDYPAVRKVLGFVATHRDYRPYDVGLKPDVKGRNILYTMARRLLGRSREDRYFQKASTVEPAWNYWRDF